MSILRDIVTAIRGGVSEAGEAIVDSQAIRILEQEIREAQEGIEKSKVSLSDLKAKELGLTKKISEIDVDISDYTAKAKASLESGDRDLARKIAEKIGELRGSREEYATQQSQLADHVEKIYAVIKKREKQIEKNRLELQKAKNYEDIQKTQKAVAMASPSNDSSAKRVQRALDKVKQKQEDADNRFAADDWLEKMESGSDLDAEISAAGLDGKTSSADDILAELEGK